MAHGVIFVDKAPDNQGAGATGNSAPRENHAAAMAWPQMQTGRPVPADRQATTSSGIGLIRPLEASARKLGAQILLQHRMTGLIRETPLRAECSALPQRTKASRSTSGRAKA